MLGMVSVHVTFDSTSYWTYVASGRASVLFVTLAGLILSVLHRRGSSSASGGQLRRRGAILVVFGIAMASTFWGSTILHYYGVMFMLAPMLLQRSTRTLVALAALAIVLGPVAVVGSTPIGNWIYGLDYEAIVSSWFLGLVHGMLVGLYALVVWVGFFIAGIALGRLPLQRWRVALMLAVASVGIALGAGWVSRMGPEPSFDEATASSQSIDLAEFSAPSDSSSAAEFLGSFASKPEDVREMPTDWNLLWSVEPHSNTTPWAVESLGIAGAIVGLLCAAPRIVVRLLRPFAALGSMTLSAYIVHSFLVQDVWTWSGANEHADRQLPMYLGIAGFLMVSAMLIRWRFRQGPFEWLLKWISGRPTSTVIAS
jgi:hypothetical protein